MQPQSVNLTILSWVIAGRDEFNLLPAAFRWAASPQGHGYWLNLWVRQHFTIAAKHKLRAIQRRAKADIKRHGSTYHEVNYPRPMRTFQ